jgi:DNA-binding transcriptional LysR family regulator
LVEDLEALTSDLGRGSTQVAGTLRITTSPTFGRLYVSPRLPEFLALHPEVRLSIHYSDERIDLAAAGFDMAIRIGKLDNPGLIARRLATNQRVLCASPGYLKKHGTPASPRDLERHQCLIQIGAPPWRLKDKSGREVPVRVTGRLESNLGDSLRDAALAGLGIALHSMWHVGADLRAGRLQVVLPAYPIADTGIYAVMPQRRLIPHRVRAFTEFLARYFGETPPWQVG